MIFLFAFPVRRILKTIRLLFLITLIIFIIGLLLPSKLLMPVEGADTSSFDKKSYWAYPWGESVTHKGIDIFADKYTKVSAPIYGLVIDVKKTPNGGNVIYLLGPKWQTHYFAHLDSVYVRKLQIVRRGQIMGTVGNTGNASSRIPHLHYSIFTFVPYVWNMDDFVPQGHLKMFYLNPEEYFE
jgi:peptidoglycan LD-endopeptidase LytH